MLIKMRNGNGTNTVISYNCEYFELIWAGVTLYMSYRQLAEIEGEVRKACALGNRVSVADVCRFFGIEPGCDDEKLFFTTDFPLEFVLRESSEELLGASGPCKVWIVDFDFAPVTIDEEEPEEEEKKEEEKDTGYVNFDWDSYFKALDELSQLRDFIGAALNENSCKNYILGKIDDIQNLVTEVK